MRLGSSTRTCKRQTACCLVNLMSTAFVTPSIEPMAQMVRKSWRSLGRPVNCTQIFGKANLALSPIVRSSILSFALLNFVCTTPHSAMRFSSVFYGNKVLKVLLTPLSTFHFHFPGISRSSSEITLGMVSVPSVTLITAALGSLLCCGVTDGGIR